MLQSTQLLLRGISAMDSAEDARDYDLSAAKMWEGMAEHFFQRYAEELIKEQMVGEWTLNWTI